MRRASSVHIDASNDVLLQGFNWEVCDYRPSWYQALAGKAYHIKGSGFAAVWMPPASVSVSKQGYMPRELEVLDSQYGTEAELRHCLATLKAAGVLALADIVVNHRCAGEQDAQGRWNKFTGRYPWDESCVCSNNPEYGGTGAAKTTESFDCAPNIDHANARVRQDIKHWLSWLRDDVGFAGWRFDFAKGYSAQWAKEYIEATKPQLAIGEVWLDCAYKGDVLEPNQDAHRQAIVDWVDATDGAAAAFDFTTKAVLQVRKLLHVKPGAVQEALKRQEYWRLADAEMRPPGMIGWWPERAVTFLENHDTGSTQNHWPFPENHLHEGYAYILLHSGLPVVFYDHVYSDGLLRPSLWRRLKSLVAKTPRLDGRAFTLLPLDRCIVALIALRRRQGITSSASVEILEASKLVYVALIQSKVLLRLGPGSWSPSALSKRQPPVEGTWKQELAGPGFVVWTLA